MTKERFEMRIDRETVELIDAWREEQPGRPSRAESVRRLLDAGLMVLGRGDFRVSHGEMLTLMMLRDLYKHLNIKGEIDPEFVGKTIWGGHLWGLDWMYPGLFHGHVDNPRIVKEVVDMLEMWHFIESGYANLTDTEKNELEVSFGSLGKDIKFPGFDGNNEGEHYSIARFLIGDLDRFQGFAGRELNSHFPHLDSYRRMWSEFEPMRITLVGAELSCSQISSLLAVAYR